MPGGLIRGAKAIENIAFAAVQVKGGFGVDAGIYFKLGIGGITGHRDFARSTGVIVETS